QVEGLEERVVPATYTWEPGNAALIIHLQTNESLTVSESAGTVSFDLGGTGTFTQSGGVAAPGGDADTLDFASTDISAFLIIDNNLATTGQNDVTFNGAGSLSLSPGTVSIDLTDPDATSTITFTGGF